MRALCAAVALFFPAIFGLTLVAAAAQELPSTAPAPSFGDPPPAAFPILYNDHTVYAKPDVLRRSRVLAAIVRNGHLYVPLRSMFEQMGATVTASADGNTISVDKAGSSASVTLGRAEVVVNGETRPLDVPPIMYQGVMLVPVRVLSEALGAYVQWVPDRRVVVVRYIPVVAPAPPPPTAAPTAVPATAAPVPMAPTPSPSPTPSSYRGFVEAAFAEPKTYNEFADGLWCRQSYRINGAYMFDNSPLAVVVDFRQDIYLTTDNVNDAYGNQFTQFSTIDGGTAIVPVFQGRQSTLDLRLEYRLGAPRFYMGVGYLRTSDDYGYPHLSGAGIGLEKLPDLRPGLSWLGSAFYYPDATGTYTVASPGSRNLGVSYRQQYSILKYDLGLALAIRHSPLYLYGGYSGDHYTAQKNAPISQLHDGPYLGLGVKF